MKDTYALSALTLNFSPGRLSSAIIALFVLSNGIFVFTRANGENRPRNADSREFQNTADGEEFYEPFYEWSVWSPCSRTCGVGVKFRGQLCLRENKALCQKKSRIYQTCNTQACPKESESFRDVQCASYNGRDIFINGERAKWKSYNRGGNQCLLFCYPDGEELFYYFGKTRDGTQCSKEPYGVCVRGQCKSVGCDYKLESGVYMDKCRVCGGNSTTCRPMRGKIQRSPTVFERLSGYADLMVIPKGATSVVITDNNWNYLALRKQNGEYVINGNRIVNWSGTFKVGDVEVQYNRISNNIKETIEITGPTAEDVTIMSLLMAGKVNMSFEYWKADGVYAAGDTLQAEKENHLVLQMGWGSWTTCSASCGGGIKVRSRYRAIEAVASFRDKETDVQRCNNEPCHMFKAAWSEWGTWGDCSVTCGGGAKIRFRYCKKPSAISRSGCPGRRYAVEQCNVEECPNKETMSATSRMQKETPLLTVTSSSILQSGNSSEERKKITESLKIPTSKLRSASEHQEVHKTSTNKLSQDRTQTVFSRGERGNSLSSSIDTLATSKSRLLLYSIKQTTKAYTIALSTRSLAEVSNLSSKFLGLEATSFVHKQTLSVSVAKEKPDVSASPVRKGTVKPTEIRSYSSSKLLSDVGAGLSVFSTSTSLPERYGIVRPSVGFVATAKASTLRTTSIGLKVSIHTGVTTRSSEVNNHTISFGFGTISNKIEGKSVLASFSEETAVQSVSMDRRQELVPSSKLSTFERTLSHQYSVDVKEIKSHDRKHQSVTLSLASDFRNEISVLVTTPLKCIPSSSRDVTRIELRLKSFSEATLQSDRTKILSTKDFSASHYSPPVKITETLRSGSSSIKNALPIKTTRSKPMSKTNELKLTVNTALRQSLEIRPESTSVSSTFSLLHLPWQTLTDCLFSHRSSKPIHQMSKLMSTQITGSKKVDASYNISKPHLLPRTSYFVSLRISSQHFATNAVLKPQMQSSFSIEKDIGDKFSFSGIYKSPIVSTNYYADFTSSSSSSSSLLSPSSSSSSLLSPSSSSSLSSSWLSYLKLSPAQKRNPMTDSPSEKGYLSKTIIVKNSEHSAKTSPTNLSGQLSSANESKSLSLALEDSHLFTVTESFSPGHETKDQAVTIRKQRFNESSTQASVSLVTSSFCTSILLSASSAVRIKSSPLSDTFGSSLSTKHTKSSISLRLTSATEAMAVAMSSSKSSLPSRQILHSVLSSEPTLSSPSTLSLNYQGVTSAMEGIIGKQMESSFNSKSSSQKKFKEMISPTRENKFHTLSSYFSTPVNIKATFTQSESLESRFPEQLFPSPAFIEFTSTTNINEKKGSMNDLKSSLPRSNTLLSKHVAFTLMPTRELTKVLAHSSKTPLLQPVLISSLIRLPTSFEKELGTTKKKLMTTPALQSLTSWQFSSGRYDEGTFNSYSKGSLTLSPSSQHVPSLVLHFNSPDHVKVTNTFLYSSRTSSSQNEALSLISPQANASTRNNVLRGLPSSSTLREETSGSINDSLRMFSQSSPSILVNSISIDERSVTATFSAAQIVSLFKYEESSLERQPLSATKKADFKINLRSYSESSSKQPMLYSKSSYQSGLQHPRSQFSEQGYSAPQTRNRSSFLKSSPSAVSLNSGSAAGSDTVARRWEQDSVSSPLPWSNSPSLSPSRLSRTKTPEPQTLMAHSFNDSSSTKSKTSSLSLDMIAVMDKTAAESSVNYQTGDTSTKFPMLKPDSFLIEAEETSIADNFKASKAEQKIPLLSRQLNFVTKAEIAPEATDSPKVSSNIHQIPSQLSPQSTSQPGVKITKRDKDSLTMYGMPSLLPSKTSSVIKVDSTSSLMQLLSIRFSPYPTFSADAQPTRGQLHSSSLQRIRLSNIPRSSSFVQPRTVKSFVRSLKMSPSSKADESPIAVRLKSTQISTASFSENPSLFSSSKQVLSSVSLPLISSLKRETRMSVNIAHSITSSPTGRRTLPLSQQQLNAEMKEQDMTNREYSVVSSSRKPKSTAEISGSLKPYSRADETQSLPSSPLFLQSTAKSTPSPRDSFHILSSKHEVSTSYTQKSSNPITEVIGGMMDSMKPTSVRDIRPSSLALLISSSPEIQSMRSPLDSSTILSSENHTKMISSRFTLVEPITSVPSLKTLSFKRENAISISSSFSGTQFQSKRPKDSLMDLSSSRHEAFPSFQRVSSLLTSLGDYSAKMSSHEVIVLSSSYGQEWLERSNLPVSFTSEKQTQSFSSKHFPPSTSSSEKEMFHSTTASLKLKSTKILPVSTSSRELVSVTAHTTILEGKPTRCPPCSLSERLHEKYCSSDYAILVRIRTGAVTKRSESSHLTKIRRIFKTNKPMKKRPEIKFTNGDCNCRPDFLLKKYYFVFGNHVSWNKTISFLEVNQDSFVAEWKETLEKEINLLGERCTRFSIIPTPRISPTVSQVTTPSLHLERKSATGVLLSTHSTHIETPTSSVKTEESCGPCENLFKRARAYCTSDFVVHVRVLTEAIDEYSHDTKYRVQLIHPFKLTRGLTTIGAVWILNNTCRCPLLLPGKQYLLMGRLSLFAAKNKPVAEITRQSYMEEWRGSMIRRLLELHKRCSPFTTEMAKVLTDISTRISTTTEEITTLPPPVTQPSTDQPSAKCRECQISRKRNKYYCDSDYVIRAKVLKESYNEVLKERRYRVRIMTVFKSKRKLQGRDDIFVFDDYCHCPKLQIKGQYVIMGKEERNTGLEDLGANSQLVIPPRSFVWKWRSRMTAGLKSIRDICDS